MTGDVRGDPEKDLRQADDEPRPLTHPAAANGRGEQDTITMQRGAKDTIAPSSACNNPLTTEGVASPPPEGRSWVEPAVEKP